MCCVSSYRGLLSIGMSTEPDPVCRFEWKKVSPKKDGEGIKLPEYCVKAENLDEQSVYIGCVSGHINMGVWHMPVNSPAKILCGGSNTEDKVIFTNGDRVYDALQKPVKAEVYALVCPEETLIRVAIDENGEIDQAYKGAVKVDSDRDPICTANPNMTCISNFLYWVSPKKLAEDANKKYICCSNASEAGRNDEQVFINIHPVVRMPLIGRTTKKPFIPGMVVPGMDDKPGRICYVDGTEEHFIEDPKHDEGTYEPTYEILVSGPKRSSQFWVCSVL